jgi:hypothetical protein
MDLAAIPLGSMGANLPLNHIREIRNIHAQLGIGHVQYAVPRTLYAVQVAFLVQKVSPETSLENLIGACSTMPICIRTRRLILARSSHAPTKVGRITTGQMILYKTLGTLRTLSDYN